ncbi:ATP-binding protein [Brucella pituitosa]|uniref:histidine kinase n=1 Tax=Brucella intermedia GD04153 TaxID=2975438 RepID=A0AA42KMM7_9HYPH|nr:ATP-binding protein [Brucella intermedia]MDH0127088.1 sensor histidine kinase N-terminal domain-containing protein [Brucella intermedia GD04153]RRD21520.1 two-component sensor histidine kinase [Brucellaceae bacterium VT-16-1752]
MPSISRRLITILIISTGMVWLFATAWIFFSTRSEVERVLDARLMEAGRMVSSLVTSQEIESRPLADLAVQLASRDHTSYDRQLSCQIWSLNGDLVSLSESAPAERLSESHDGFSQTEIDGETWRVYAVVNKEIGVRVLVGDTLKVRSDLVNDVIRGLLLPMLPILPVLAGLIWFSVRRGLSPLNRIAHDLEQRHASDLSPLAGVEAAKEIVPVVNSLNGLFERVTGLRDRERNFTAFAAHELRTPLAGLKTQAQVALASKDMVVRDQALRQIMVGVDRTGRLIRQLLDISSVEAKERPGQEGVVVAGRVLCRLASELSDPARDVTVEVAPDLDDLHLSMEPELFTLAARNLIENAVNHSPTGGTVRCISTKVSGRTAIIIEDDGPGIPEEELPHVTERFFRGRNKAAVGSGLGLAIVELALDRSSWQLSLANRPSGGLCATIAQA